MNTRANFVKGMVNDAYDYSIESYNAKPMVFQDLYDTESSEGSYEQYTTVVGPASFGRVGESVTIPRVNIAEGFTIQIANFKMATEMAMSNESIDDNRHIKNMLKSWAQGLGESARIKQE